jgi:hypothetical protein
MTRNAGTSGSGAPALSLGIGRDMVSTVHMQRQQLETREYHLWIAESPSVNCPSKSKAIRTILDLIDCNE